MTSLSTNCRTVATISVWTSVSPAVWASLVMRRPSRRRRPGPARRRCTWSPGRSGHSRRSSSRASVASIRPPVAPTGWPSEMPEPCTFVRSRSAPVNSHSRITASACAANASLSSMRSMSASVSPALPRATSARGHRADAHDVRRNARDTPGDQPDQRPSALVRRPSPRVVTMHIEAASFCPLELPAVTVASGSLLAAERVSALLSASTEVSARGCSSVSITSSPCRVRTVTGMISSARIAVLLRGHRPLVRRDGEFVLFGSARCRTADADSRRSRACRRAPGSPAHLRWCGHALRRVVHLHAGARPSPAHVGRVEHDVAHALGPAGDDEVVLPVGNLQARLDHGLQTRTTAAVQLHAGHGHRQPRVQSRPRGRSPAPRCSDSSGPRMTSSTASGSIPVRSNRPLQRGRRRDRRRSAT